LFKGLKRFELLHPKGRTKMRQKTLKLFTVILFCLSFTRLQGQTVKDIDGNVYKTVTIGKQVWMKENLKVTRYLNGDLIGSTTPAKLDISGESTPKYQWAYNGSDLMLATYGRLYTWYAVTDSRNVCPDGWHIPSDAEWAILIDFFGGTMDGGSKMKETGGFKALNGGYRSNDGYGGAFNYLERNGYWWSSTESGESYAWYQSIDSGSSGVNRIDDSKFLGLSVRCIKN
jgi:uncharacterized protein (TIGR02145 family)